MKRSYLETIFRHKAIVIVPIIIGVVLGAGLAYSQPRTYVSQATLWVEAITSNADSPAAGESVMLSQMLATRKYTRSLVEISPYAREYASMDPLSGDYFLGSIAGSVMASTPGPQLLALSVSSQDPDEAVGLLQAVLTQFQEFRSATYTDRLKAVVEVNRGKVEAARDAAAKNSSKAAQQQLDDALAAYTDSVAAVDSVATSTPLQVVDAPSIASPQGRMKTVVFGAAGGFLAGLTISILALLLLMSRDRSLRSEEDARAAGFDVVGSIPRLRAPRHQEAPVMESVQ